MRQLEKINWNFSSLLCGGQDEGKEVEVQVTFHGTFCPVAGLIFHG